MLLTGQEYLQSIRDGRKVYVGRELVDDVTRIRRSPTPRIRLR